MSCVDYCLLTVLVLAYVATFANNCAVELLISVTKSSELHVDSLQTP